METQWYYIFSAIAIMVGGLWSMFAWVSNKFQHAVDLVLGKMEKLQDAILAKIEYHEKHDDKRFDQVTNELWTIKLRNAAIDAAKLAKNEASQEKNNQ